MGADDVGVDLRVLLPGIPEQHERQPRVQLQNLVDPAVLLLAAGRRAEKVTQEHWARREVVVAQERDQERVQVPWARRDVEEGVGAGGEVAVELGAPLNGVLVSAEPVNV